MPFIHFREITYTHWFSAFSVIIWAELIAWEAGADYTAEVDRAPLLAQLLRARVNSFWQTSKKERSLSYLFAIKIRIT